MYKPEHNTFFLLFLLIIVLLEIASAQVSHQNNTINGLPIRIPSRPQQNLFFTLPQTTTATAPRTPTISSSPLKTIDTGLASSLTCNVIPTAINNDLNPNCSCVYDPLAQIFRCDTHDGLDASLNIDNNEDMTYTHTDTIKFSVYTHGLPQYSAIPKVLSFFLHEMTTLISNSYSFSPGNLLLAGTRILTDTTNNNLAGPDDINEPRFSHFPNITNIHNRSTVATDPMSTLRSILTNNLTLTYELVFNIRSDELSLLHDNLSNVYDVGAILTKFKQFNETAVNDYLTTHDKGNNEETNNNTTSNNTDESVYLIYFEQQLNNRLDTILDSPNLMRVLSKGNQTVETTKKTHTHTNKQYHYTLAQQREIAKLLAQEISMLPHDRDKKMMMFTAYFLNKTNSLMADDTSPIVNTEITRAFQGISHISSLSMINCIENNYKYLLCPLGNSAVISTPRPAEHYLVSIPTNPPPRNANVKVKHVNDPVLTYVIPIAIVGGLLAFAAIVSTLYCHSTKKFCFNTDQRKENQLSTNRASTWRKRLFLSSQQQPQQQPPRPQLDETLYDSDITSNIELTAIPSIAPPPQIISPHTTHSTDFNDVNVNTSNIDHNNHNHATKDSHNTERLALRRRSSAHESTIIDHVAPLSMGKHNTKEKSDTE